MKRWSPGMPSRPASSSTDADATRFDLEVCITMTNVEPGLGAVDRGYVTADRDDVGPLLVFTGDVSKEAVRRFQLLVPAADRPGRVDLTAATLLSSAAIDLLRHLSARQTRAGARLVITVSDPVVRHQLVATGITSLASVQTVLRRD